MHACVCLLTYMACVFVCRCVHAYACMCVFVHRHVPGACHMTSHMTFTIVSPCRTRPRTYWTPCLRKGYGNAFGVH